MFPALPGAAGTRKVAPDVVSRSQNTTTASRKAVSQELM